MKETTNYHLKKPEETDFYDVEDFNYNADLIDEKLSNLEHNTTLIQNSGGGFAAGTDAAADTGGAVGRKAWTGDGGAVGYLAYAANGGGSAGKNANSNAGGAVGADAKAGAGFAGGSGAKAVNSSNNGIDAIQLGTGTNSTPKTLQVYGHQLLDANGNIPIERLSNVPQAVEEIEVTTNDIFMADELDHFTCGMEEIRTAVIRQHFIYENTAYGTAMFITVESRTATYNGLQDGHPFLIQTLYYSPGLVYTRTGTNKNDGSMLYEWENWELEKNFVGDAPSDGNTYARKDGEWSAISTGGGMSTLSWDEMDDFEKGIATVTRSYTTTDTGSGTHYSDVCLLIAGSFYITYNGAQDGPAQRRQALIYPDGKIITRITNYGDGQWNEWKEYVPSAS